MKVTLKLLEEWGACERYRKVFAEQFPDGVEGTAKEIAAIPEDEYDQWWILVEMAVRLNDRDGEEALRLATERVDPSRLAVLVARVRDKDTSAAFDKLVRLGDKRGLSVVIRRGPVEAAQRAVKALESAGAERTLDYCEAEFSPERAQVVREARKGVRHGV